MDDINTVPTPVTETRDTRDRLTLIWNDAVAAGKDTLRELLAACELYVALRQALEIIVQAPPSHDTWPRVERDPCTRYCSLHHRASVDLLAQIKALEERHAWITLGGLKADWDAALARAKEARAVRTSWRPS